jgi:hypothetical protein
MSKYNRTYHFPFSPGATNDDRIAETMSNLIGQEIVITEKLDGENCGMTDGGVYARSHAAYTTSPWSKEVRNLHKLVVEDELGDGVYLFGEIFDDDFYKSQFGDHDTAFQNIITILFLLKCLNIC